MIKKIFDLRHIIILLLILLCLVEFFNPRGIMPHRIFTIHDTVGVPVHDTVGVEVPTEVQVPIEVEKPVPFAVHDTLTIKADTNQIVEQYLNSKNIYVNTYKFLNNQGSITITDTIGKNKILGRKYSTKITPIIDTLRLPAIFKRELYLGFETRFDKPNFVELVGLGVMYKIKDNKIFKLDIGAQNKIIDGTNGKFAPYIGGGVYWKVLSSKK